MNPTATVSSFRLGLGCTALAHSRLTGHADGIATYTGELLQHYRQGKAPFYTLPTVFGKRYAGVLDKSTAFPWVYSISTGCSAITELPFRGATAVESEIDLFHATDHYIPRLKHTPVVATIMDVIGLRHPEWVNPRLRQLKNHLFRKAAGWADHIITISEFSAQDISDAYGIGRDRITPIGLGVNPVFFERVSEADKTACLRQYDLEPGFFLVVGTLQPRKNIERTLAAHALLPTAVRKTHPLVVVGQEGWRSDGIRQQLQEVQAQGYGKWLRYVPRPHLHALLQSAQALLFASLYEGFGLPLIEGFASQVPVISANTTCLPEVAGDAALLVNPLDPQAIAQAMQQTLSHDTLARTQWIAKGLVQARRYTWEATAQATEAVYQRMR